MGVSSGRYCVTVLCDVGVGCDRRVEQLRLCDSLCVVWQLGVCCVCCVLCDSWGFVVFVFVLQACFQDILCLCLVCVRFYLSFFKPSAVLQPLSSFAYYLFLPNTSLLHLTFFLPPFITIISMHFISPHTILSHSPHFPNKTYFLTVQTDGQHYVTISSLRQTVPVFFVPPAVLLLCLQTCVLQCSLVSHTVGGQFCSLLPIRTAAVNQHRLTMITVYS
jgi:hypothetical protein